MVASVSVRDLLKGNILILTVGTMIRAMTLFVTFPYFSLYIRELGGDNVVIGLVSSFRPLAAMLMYPIAGSIVDAYGRKRVLVLMEYLNATVYIVFMLAPDWRVLAAANFLTGLLVFRFPASSALFADSMPSQLRGRGFAFIIALQGLVGVFTPYLGGYLLTVFGTVKGMRILYGATTLGLYLVATIDWRYLEETMPPRDDVKHLSRIVRGSYSETFRTLRGMPLSLWWYASVLVVSLFFNSVAGSYWVVYASDVVNLTKVQWGTLLTVSTVIYTALSYPAGALIDRYNKTRILAGAMMLAAPALIYFPHAKGYTGVLLALVPIAVANGFLMPGAGALMADLCPKELRGRLMAALGNGNLMVNTIGGGGGGPGVGFLLTFPSVLGLVTGGFIYEAWGALPWYLLGGAHVASALVLWYMVKPEGVHAE